MRGKEQEKKYVFFNYKKIWNKFFKKGNIEQIKLINGNGGGLLIGNSHTIDNGIKFGWLDKNNNFPLLNMEMDFSKFNIDIKNTRKSIYNQNNVSIYKNFTKDFINNGGYSFDDAPFVIDIDFIDILFENQYFQKVQIAPLVLCIVSLKPQFQ